MFKITTVDDGARLVSSDPLTDADYERIGTELGLAPTRARKVGFVAAARADKQRRIETRWNGRETTAVAEPGDFIATNLNARREALRDGEGRTNIYVIKAQRFADLYEKVACDGTFGDIYRSRGEVDTLFLPGGFEILAPWGETQTAPSGYLIRNGRDIYGNNRETFEATYEMLS